MKLLDVKVLSFTFWQRINWTSHCLICSWHRNLQNIRIRILQIFVLIFFNDLWQKIWGALEKNIRLGFIKGFVITEWFVLLLIKQKNHNKRFGEFEFEYFGGSDVMNRLIVIFWIFDQNKIVIFAFFETIWLKYDSCL